MNFSDKEGLKGIKANLDFWLNLDNYLKKDKLFESKLKFFVLLTTWIVIFYFIFRGLISYFNL